MNRIAKSVAVGLLAISAGSAWAVDGTIEFNGAIRTSTCEFANGDTIAVELRTYARDQFRFVGDKTPSIPFTIPLINCPTVAWEHVDNTVDASFQLWLETRSGGTVGTNNELAKVSSMGTAATGVGIRIDKADDGTQMALNKLNTPAIKFPITDTSVNVDLVAYYVSTVESSSITPGEADASVDVTIDYR